MPRTIAVRVSVAFGLVLLVTGGGMFAYGAYVGATADSGEGISLEIISGASDPTEGVPVWALPPDQEGLLLLTLGTDSNTFTTTDERISATVTELPKKIRFREEFYQVQTVVSDSATGGGLQVAGLGLGAAGMLTIVAAAVDSIRRRIWD
jgi:hypothetical protein